MRVHRGLIGGHTSVSASSHGGLLVRVDPAQNQALLDQPHTEPFVTRGRVMDGWLLAETDGLRTKRQLERWVVRGVTHARSLPPQREA